MWLKLLRMEPGLSLGVVIMLSDYYVKLSLRNRHHHQILNMICSSNPKLKAICHLLYQTTIYSLWRERNSRIHSGTPKPSRVIKKDITTLLRAKLAGLDQAATRSTSSRSAGSNNGQGSFLYNWFMFIQI
ncbi:hypothetical protein HID58_007525 [Brassica napus]|uniref:Uncharacterized protein n=1 Tax=Brassica napus TaxID=3708 RepID=A0ABQ8EEF2_BRANA|nr:hypothetical protein HID58_007525 [Brassica napus]